MTLTARLRLIEARSRALLGAQDKRIEKVVRICSCFPEFTPPRAAIIRGQVRAWLAANPDATDMDLAMCPPARELAQAILVENQMSRYRETLGHALSACDRDSRSPTNLRPGGPVLE